MENENMMENYEVTEVTEDCEDTNSGRGLKVIGGILATAATGGLVWCGLKLKKILKARKEEKCNAIIESNEETEDVEPENVEVKTTEKSKKSKK